MISVQGTDFKPFVKLVSEQGYNIPFAILTDGDSDSDIDDNDEAIEASLSRGEKRGVDIVTTAINSDFMVENSAMTSNTLQTQGVFVGQHTLEVDLLPFYETEMVQVYDELVKTDRARNVFRENVAAARSGNADEFLKRLSRKGKGRFAQKLAPKIVSDRCPDYIRLCLEYIASKVEPLLPPAQPSSVSGSQIDENTF